MAFGAKIEDFHTWANQIGCPPKLLPSDDALKYIFKSHQGQLFVQLQSRIQPRQDVQNIRENLIIAKIKKNKDTVISARSRHLPRELQTLLKMQELQRKKECAELKLTDIRKEYDALASNIKSKNIQAISATQKKDLLVSKKNLLELKLEFLISACAVEVQNKAKIQSSMPVKVTGANSNEENTFKSVEQALKELDIYYNIFTDNTSSEVMLTSAKERLWAQMHHYFADMPNNLFFSVILKMKENHLQHIMELNKMQTQLIKDPKASTRTSYVKPPLTKFDIKLLKTKAELLGLVAKYLCVKNEVADLEERFSIAYNSFVIELQKRVDNFNDVEEDESNTIISDFLVEYNSRHFNCSRNDYLTEQIEQLRQEMEVGTKQLDNHELLLGTVKQMYGDISSSVNRIQQEMLQLSQIKEKILYSKNMLKNMLDTRQATSHNLSAKNQFLSSKLKLNMSLLGTDSFSMANDSVFSSTKLELDANASAMTMDNTTLMPGQLSSTTTNQTLCKVGGTSGALPCHLSELNTFYETPLGKFSCVPRSCSFAMSPNPLIVESPQEQLLLSTVQLAPGLLFTPYGGIQEVRKRILWAATIAGHSSELKLNLNLDSIIVNPHELKKTAKQQYEQILEVLDNMAVMSAKTQTTLNKSERILKFILENPLSRYVPATKLLNNANYSDCESEFNLYYGIATPSGQFK